MALLLSWLILAAVFLVLFWYAGYAWETFQMVRRPDRVIYHGSNLREQGPHLETLIRKYVPDTAAYALVEPGAGLGTVSRYLAQRFPWREATAIEVGPYILGLARMRAFFERSPVRFIKEDMFAYRFPQHSVVYCYLFPVMLQKLKEQGSLDGSLVISLTFPIPECPETEKVPLPSWQKALFVYDFRELSRAAQQLDAA